jgi:hypothetical protein
MKAELPAPGPTAYRAGMQRRADDAAGPMPIPTAERLRRLLGSPVRGAVAVARGYTNNARWVVALEDGRTAFVKQAVDGPTRDWLRGEYRMYAWLDGPWVPRLLGWDDGEEPLLVLEDLSAWTWPPPWTAARVESVRAALAEIAPHPPPPGLPRLVDSDVAAGGWPEVARDPAAFLGLGLCSERWLAGALERLLEAADPRLLDGDALCHNDVRSDNLCFRPTGRGDDVCWLPAGDGSPAEPVVLVDWNHAAVGNPEFDLAFWLPSLSTECGPPPQEVAELDPGMVALVAGFFASRAGLPIIPVAPKVREIQRVQLEIALPWAATALGLPPPDRAG